MIDSNKQNKMFSENRPGFNIFEILQMINRRKILLISSVIITLTVAILYNYFASPSYETTVVMKKERTQQNRRQDQFRNIILMETADEIETEIEIVQSRTILEQVVRKLRLHFMITKIEQPYREPILLNKYWPDYEHSFFGKKQAPDNFPRFKIIEIVPPYRSGKYYIVVSEPQIFSLCDAKSNMVLQSVDNSSVADFTLGGIHLSVDWPSVKVGSKVYFTVSDFEKTILDLSRKVAVEKVRKTDIFRIKVTSNSPFMARLVANTVAKTYQEVRIEQKKQTIRYSFGFLDEQLRRISAKLKEAENKLSEFQSETKLISIDENSKSIIDFLNKLETEKVTTDLVLAEYQQKLSEMKKELHNRNFFDQTFLTPDRADVNRTPFSELMRELSDTELKRLELLQKRTENHPDVIALDEKIKQIKDRLAKYNQNTITAYQIIINSLEKKQSDLQKLLDKYARRISRLPAQQTKLIDLMRQKSVYEKIFTMLLDKREEMRMAELSQLQDLVIVDSARAPLRAASPRKKLNLAIGLALGLIMGLLAIFIQEYHGNLVTTIDEIENGFSYPILTLIPQYPRALARRIRKASKIEERLVTLMNEPVFKEAYRNLRTKLINLYSGATRVILITSCEENSGKTSIVANFAISLARMGKRVLIIDGDLKKSHIGKYFMLENVTAGLGDYLVQDVKLTVHHPFDLSKHHQIQVDIIPSGRYWENSSEILSSSKFKKLIEAAKTKYDYILLDTPPITRVVDTFVLGRIVRDVILVIRPNQTYKDAVAWAVAEFKQSSMNLLGFVLNAFDLKKTTYRYKYRYGYGDGKSYREKKSA